jgi:glycosyltransferase involved in cell wall biosynthesis
MSRPEASPPNKTLLVLSQVYVPDPTSVGQHMADAAAAMAARGYRVVTLAANRGYNDPSVKYESREVIDGVEIRRLPFSSFGKRSIAIRILAALSFVTQCTIRGLFTRNLHGILVSTSPPICSVAALVISWLRPRARITYWVMDLNPDQMVEMGWISPRSPIVKIFDWFNRRILKRATNVITLDRYMAERVLRKVDIRDKLTVAPPWPHEDHLDAVPHETNPFRAKHDLQGKFVIMYSGNHSVCTPLRTILEAALRLEDQDELVFMFIGAGTGKKEVDDLIAQRQPRNIRSLPYQPFSEVKYSLSAADVHLVVIGNQEVGSRHPCKIYGAMALGRPVLLVGPDPCHASDLIAKGDIGWHVQHGDVDRATTVIEQIVASEPRELAQRGARAQQEVVDRLSKVRLCGQFSDLIERSMNGEARAALSGEPDKPQQDQSVPTR